MPKKMVSYRTHLSPDLITPTLYSCELHLEMTGPKGFSRIGEDFQGECDRNIG